MRDGLHASSGLDGCSIGFGLTAPPYSVRPGQRVLPQRFSQSGLIGSGEAASNRRLPPPEPSNPAPSWHVPLPVLTGPLWEAARLVGRFLVVEPPRALGE